MILKALNSIRLVLPGLWFTLMVALTEMGGERRRAGR